MKPKKMRKIIFFPKYSSKGPSSRYRIYSYLPYYKDAGLDFSVSPLFGDWYLEHIWKHRAKWRLLLHIVYAYLKRLFQILLLPSNTIVYIGAELFPYCPFGIECYLKWRKIPYLVEYDDAIFHYYDQSSNRWVRFLLTHKTKKVIHNAAAIITGCQYLTDYARQWNNNVFEIPTSVDADKYALDRSDKRLFTIGWIGSPASSKYLEIVIPALRKLTDKYEFELDLIGFDSSYEFLLKGINYRLINWDSNTEVQNMSYFSVGIMPLPKTKFAQGKCAFKLVQYMAMGIPTISTPLQSNVNIDKGCGNLFADTEEDWYKAFEQVICNSEQFLQVGRENREVAMKYYTFQSNWEKYYSILKALSRE